MTTEEYTLEDLESMSGLSIRTLRFYIQEGLLPGPDTRGKFARYSQTHLDTIRFIERLKKVHMPLKQIRHLLETMSSREIEDLLQSGTEGDIILSIPQLLFEDKETGKQKGKQQTSSALEYIRNLESLQGSMEIKETSTRYSIPPAPSRAPAPLGEFFMIQPETGSEASGEAWQRIRLAEGVELHLRQPLSNEKEQAVRELIRTSRQLFRKTNKKGEK